MTLQEYLEEASLTPAQFAERVRVARTETVLRWLKGKRLPDPESMRTIALATGCKVTPNDWLSVKQVA